MATTFESKCSILADLWLNHQDNEALEDFFEYNDLGLPLAYCINSKLAESTEDGVVYVEQTFTLLCRGLGVDLDGEYESLNELMYTEEQPTE
jgi:hypothetical protein